MTQTLPAWPFGDGEMVGRIRGVDWAATPLGAIGSWPQSLRTVTDLVLAMPGPATILYGPARVQLYNDAYVAIARDRHPALLGRPVADGWPETCEAVVAPLLAETDAGRAVRLTDFPVALRGADGALERRVFDTAWSPVRDAAGAIAGALQTLTEVTDDHRAREALRASEARLAAAFESVPAGIAVLDMAGRIVTANSEYRRFLPGGVMPSRDPERGWRWRAWDADGRPIAPDGFPGARAMRGERVVPGQEMLYTRDDGQEIWTRVVSVPIRDAAGRVTGQSSVISDIDALKRNAEALERSEARFRAFVTASSDVVYRINSDGSEMRRLEGRAFLPDTGQPGVPWLERYIDPDDRSAVAAAIAEAVAARSIFELEHGVIRSDGTRGRTLSRAVPILDGAGAIREWLGTASDVTARRLAEEARRDSEARLRQFGEASSDVLWMRDAATFQWTYLTPAFEAIYGLDRATALAGDNMTGWIDLIVPEDRETAVASLARVRAGARVTFEYRIRRPVSGEIRWVRDTDFPMRDAAGAVRWIGGIGRDITEEKATAEHLGVLVAELQHRTRNLMGVVRVTADKTLANSADLSDFRARYTARLGALARVQGMLSRLGEGDRITFDALIRSEIAALDGEPGKVTLVGPPGVALRSSTLQIFALALHELATNALKYGALAQAQGRLEIRWHVRPAPWEPGGEPWLHVDWRERGVRVAAGEGASASGAGRELIERALPYQLGARTTYAIHADGVHCTIALPVSGRMMTGTIAQGTDDA